MISVLWQFVANKPQPSKDTNEVMTMTSVAVMESNETAVLSARLGTRRMERNETAILRGMEMKCQITENGSLAGTEM